MTWIELAHCYVLAASLITGATLGLAIFAVASIGVRR